ncbi:unnamed protein product [Tenebrio molitor]|nr:unnamed protein product [Tenebrio molitor]
MEELNQKCDTAKGLVQELYHGVAVLAPRSRSSARLTPLHAWGKYRRKNALATINNRELHQLKIVMALYKQFQRYLVHSKNQ